jgi:hypothetical protein
VSDKKKRSPAETWNRVEAMAIDDDLEDITTMSEDELDRELSAAGGDPAEIGKQGAALVDKLIAARTKK